MNSELANIERIRESQEKIYTTNFYMFRYFIVLIRNSDQ
jgi:hypothetical protein